MHDIRIPEQSGEEGEGLFAGQQQQSGQGGFSAHHMSELEPQAVKRGEDVGDKVKVKFDKFVQLVATHDFEEAIAKNPDEDVIISTNLLADLANAHEEEDNGSRRMPVIFLIGVILGIIVTYLLVQY